MFSFLKRRDIRFWELALTVGLVTAMFFGLGASLEARSLSNSLLRLHVVANSDSETDQALKLIVRDRVLEAAGEIIKNEKTSDGAALALDRSMNVINEAASAALRAEGYDYEVKAELTRSFFPTKTYDGFALPAGQYEALRVTIGEGAGKNWWCVVFPPLCASAAGDFEEAATAGGLSDEQVRLITEEEGGYEIRFQILEIFGQIAGLFGD